MRINYKFLLLILCLPVTTGCVTTQTKIPEFENGLNIYPSSGYMSSMTEVAISDHLVENSQVYVAGNEIFGSLLGLIGYAIDKARNRTEINSNDATLSVRFDNTLSEIVSSEFKSVNNIPTNITRAEDQADIILIPSARLVVDNNKKASAMFRLTVRFVDPVSKRRQTKNYYFYDAIEYLLVGENSWSAGNAELLRQHSRAAYSKLISVLHNDMEGNYKSVNEQDKPDLVKHNVNGFMTLKLVVLEKFDDYVLTTNQNNGKANFHSFMIYPSDSVTRL